MLNRRFLRIKIMQALYSYFRDEHADLKTAEKNLFTSIDKTYDLFLHLLSFVGNLHFSARIALEDARGKRLPTQEDLNPNEKFLNNSFLLALAENKAINNEFAKRTISWQNDQDLVRKLFAELKTTAFYKEYMQNPEASFGEDRKLIKQILSDLLYEHELFNFWFEERNIHWTDDLYFAFVFLNKWLDAMEGPEDVKLPPLYRDPSEDKKFVEDLFRKTIMHWQEFDAVIDRHTKNWELERIAILDILLMKMALGEILFISNVPVKVSMNEYIDLAKEYSSPQSGRFINGVLDKMVAELKAENKIQKTGRGLLES
jgi:transcription antitermination protein NusB